MPFFEYKCNSCESIFTDIKNINNEEIIICRFCKSDSVVKIISLFNGISKNSSKKNLDCIIGESAEKKWEKIYDRKENRRKREI